MGGKDFLPPLGPREQGAAQSSRRLPSRGYICAHHPGFAIHAGISLETPNLSFPPLDLMQRVLRRGAYRSVGAQPQTAHFRIISGLG